MMMTTRPYVKKVSKTVVGSLRCTVVLLLSLAAISAIAQPDTASVHSRKLRTFAIAGGVTYGTGLAILNHVWYKDTKRQSFRFFNDNAEWKQLDKAGHAYASFYLSEIPATVLRNIGMDEKKADLIGALSGFLLTAPIEILDGYSDGYGASVGDLVADAVGPLLYLGQKALWSEVRVRPKFSFHRTKYADMRPELLGDNTLSQIVKDYNGQTYWLSVDIDRFIAFPRWLNLSVGYGAEEMIYARDGQNHAAGLRPYRQYYLGIDFDPSAVKTRSRFVRTVLYVLGSVRVPAPAISVSKEGVRFHPLYF